MTVSRSNFTTAQANSAWYVVADANQGNVFIGTNGKTFNAVLQTFLRNAPELVNAVPTYDGTTIRGTDISPDGNWAAKTYKGLWSLMSAKGQAAALPAIATAARSRTIPRAMVALAAKVIADGQMFHVPLTGVMIPANAVLPRFGVAPPGSILTSTTARPATAEEVAAASGRAPATVSPTPDSRSTTNGVPNTSTPAPNDGKTEQGGVGTSSDKSGASSAPDDRGDEPAPGPSPRIPTGTPPRTVTTGTGLTAGPIIAIVVGLAAVGILGYTLMTAPAAPAPRLARARTRRR